MLTLEVFGDFFVPEGDVGFTVIDDWPQFGITTQVCHEAVHSFKTLDEIYDAVLGRLLIEGAGGVVDRLSQNGWEANAHGCVGKRVFVISPEGRPWGVIRVDLDWEGQRRRTRKRVAQTLDGVLGQGALMSFLSGR